MKNPVLSLLFKNTSPSRLIGFIISNFIGLAIVVGAIMFYEDAGSLWSDEDSFVKRDYLVVNKKIGGNDLWDGKNSEFTDKEIADLKDQPWVRRVGPFMANDYRVWAEVTGASRGMSTMLFFESVPDEFVDGLPYGWNYEPGQETVPIIISKDYLTLYNFGFAGSAGLPKLSESLMAGIPLILTLISDDGHKVKKFNANIIGFSNRLNTILVPQKFMDWSNSEFGNSSSTISPSRLIIDVSSPGDVAITDYLDKNGLEVAGDKKASSASYLLKVITGIILAIGVVITLLSFFILLLSISLLMEKNREKIHSLLMLGYPLARVSYPYIIIAVVSSLVAYGLAVLCCLLLRNGYIEAMQGLGAYHGKVWVALMCGAILTIIILVLNCISILRRTRLSWR